MKPVWLIPALLALSLNGWAQAGALYNADVSEMTSIMDPAKALPAVEGHWLAFSIPALADTQSPCCWKGKWNGMGESGCSLEGKHQSYGTRSDSPVTENIVVFTRIENGNAGQMRVVGESCPVDGNGGQVTWIGGVDDTAALDWLENVVCANGDPGADAALMAIALHRNPEAGRRLHALAGESGGDHAQEAVFWLGESRGEQGFEILKALLAELPKGDTRREINFALAQNQAPGAADLLYEIARSDPDPEQRGQAMFWLAQEYPLKAQGWLLDVIRSERDKEVLEEAVFAISQLPGDDGDKVLLDLARDPGAPRAVRRQAIFWLAQSDNDASIAALTDLLSQ
jgi:hypothetical protein